MIAGLLVGHWVTQSKAPASPQVIKVEGLARHAPRLGDEHGARTTSTTPTAGRQIQLVRQERRRKGTG